MDIAHIIELDRLLKDRRTPIPLNRLLEQLECSKSTFHRIRSYMCDVLGAPIKFAKNGGYFYDLKECEKFELPGLWFSPQEIVALSMLEQIGQSFQPKFVKQILSPIDERLTEILKKQGITEQGWQNRLKIISQWQRPCEPKYFANIAHALLHRQRIEIKYWQWNTNTNSHRIISPQRLVYYRDNWYLDAFCHLKNALRTFSVDAIKEAKRLKQKAKDVETEILDQHVTSGYGIFAGQAKTKATLKFSPAYSNRASQVNWHPEQTAYWTQQHEYVLTIPYSDDRELVRDILSLGSDVEVLAPEVLKQAVKRELEVTLQKYF